MSGFRGRRRSGSLLTLLVVTVYQTPHSRFYRQCATKSSVFFSVLVSVCLRLRSWKVESGCFNTRSFQKYSHGGNLLAPRNCRRSASEIDELVGVSWRQDPGAAVSTAVNDKNAKPHEKKKKIKNIKQKKSNQFRHKCLKKIPSFPMGCTVLWVK